MPLKVHWTIPVTIHWKSGNHRNNDDILSLGLRSSETKDRALFALILDERTLRAEAEFRNINNMV